MRLTEFWERMNTHFGPGRAETFARDQVITELGDRTVYGALEAGVPTREVWKAVCAWADIPARLR